MSEEITTLLDTITNVEVKWLLARKSLSQFLTSWSNTKYTRNDLIALSLITNTLTHRTKILEAALCKVGERLEEQKVLEESLGKFESNSEQIFAAQLSPNYKKFGTSLHQEDLQRRDIIDLAWEYINFLQARILNVEKYFAKRTRSGFCIDYSEIGDMVMKYLMTKLEAHKTQEMLLVMELDNREKIMGLCVVDGTAGELMLDSYVRKTCKRARSVCHKKREKISRNLRKCILRMKRNKL